MIQSASQPVQHVEITAGVCGGKPRIAGTRIRVWDIARLSQTGLSPDEILLQYPQLSLADVYAALAYYFDHRKEIDHRAAEDDDFAEQLRQSLNVESPTAPNTK